MLRPEASVSRIVDAFTHVLDRCDEEGVQLILLSGANPSGQLPLGRVFQRRGDLLTAAVTATIADRPDIVRAFNWPDRELVDRRVLVGGPAAHELARPPPRRSARARLRSAWSRRRSGGRCRRCPQARRAERRTTASTSGRGCGAASPARRRATAASRSTRRGPRRAVDALTKPGCRARRLTGRGAPSRRARRTARPAAPTRAAVDPTRAGGGGAAVPRRA